MGCIPLGTLLLGLLEPQVGCFWFPIPDIAGLGRKFTFCGDQHLSFSIIRQCSSPERFPTPALFICLPLFTDLTVQLGRVKTASPDSIAAGTQAFRYFLAHKSQAQQELDWRQPQNVVFFGLLE